MPFFYNQFTHQKLKKNMSIWANLPVGEEGAQELLFWEEAKLTVFLNAAAASNGGKKYHLCFKGLKNYGREMANKSPLFGMAEGLAGQWRWGCADLASTLRNQLHMMLAPATEQKHIISYVQCNVLSLKEKHVLCYDWYWFVLMFCVLSLFW